MTMRYIFNKIDLQGAHQNNILHSKDAMVFVSHQGMGITFLSAQGRNFRPYKNFLLSYNICFKTLKNLSVVIHIKGRLEIRYTHFL